MKPLLFALALAGLPLLGSASSSFAAPSTVVNPNAPKPKAPAARPVAATAAPAANAIAADVNGEKITVAELDQRVEAKKASEPALQSDSPAATNAMKLVRTQMLDDLVTIKLLRQEARRQKIVAAPKDVDASMTQLRAQFKTDAELNKWLSDGGATQADMRARIADELAMDELTARITSDITVSDADISTFYRANPDDFTIQAAVKARHILLAVNPNASAADKEAVRKRAQNLIAQLKKGANFAVLAKANSDDQTNKDLGGELPVFERGMMVPEFEKAAFNAKKGDIVGPVETNYGMHIVRIEEVLPQKLVDLKDVKEDPRLRLLILREKKQKSFNEFLDRLKASAKIQKFV